MSKHLLELRLLSLAIHFALDWTEGKKKLILPPSQSTTKPNGYSLNYTEKI